MEVLTTAIISISLLSLIGATSYHLVRAYSLKGRTLSDYKNNYPEHIGYNRINCHSCNHNQVILKRIGYNLVSIINSHICQHCGTELYRTKTRV